MVTEECKNNRFETNIYSKIDKECFEQLQTRGYKIWFDCQKTEV